MSGCANPGVCGRGPDQCVYCAEQQGYYERAVENGACTICVGAGDIWVSWHPTPVTCGHCHGTGKAPESETS